MRSTDRTGLAIILSLFSLALFDEMGLVIEHLSATYSATELAVWRNFFGLLPSLIALIATSDWKKSGYPLYRPYMEARATAAHNCHICIVFSIYPLSEWSSQQLRPLCMLTPFSLPHSLLLC